ncbi:MAG TPA: RNA polymerase sigma factor [bacterium]|nr:RNA polymerase sigma factor [bacterium]
MDIWGLRALLERSHRENYGWALSCCSHDLREAEDVLQTVYLKVLDGKARYDGRATFKTWLFSVIRNTAVEERRRTILRRLLWIKCRKNTDHVVEGDLDEAAHQSQIRALLRSTLAALPKRQREVLQLVFYHGFSLQEAADVMGISIGSARTHYDRGKKRLRQWLEESKILDE